MADFISSRNKHRRIYGYERNPKQPFTIIEDGVHRTFDKNSITVHRDYFLIRDSNFQQGVYSEYEENLINVLGYSGVVTFQNGGFTQLPIVTIEPTNPSSDNVNFYLTDITQYGFTYGVSSFFSGDTFDNGLNSQMNAYLQNAINSILSNTSSQTAADVLSKGVAQVLKQYGQQ